MATLTTVTITLTDGGATPVMTVDEAAKLVAATIRVFNHKKVTATYSASAVALAVTNNA